MLGHRNLEVSEYLGILKRRRWLLLGFALTFPILGMGVTRFLQPKFQSQTLVLIEDPKVSEDYVKPIIATSLDSRLSSMKEQILSRSRVQPIIEHYNLYGTQHMTMDDRVELTRKAIDIKPIHSAVTTAGGLPGFFISFTASDAHTAQLVCGEITSLFLNENLRLREASAQGTTDFLEGQLQDAKRILDEQDKKMAEFQQSHFGNTPAEASSNVGIMNSLNSQMDAATQALATLDQQKTYQQSMLTSMQENYAAQMSRMTGGDPTGSVATDDPPGTPQQRKQLSLLEDKERELTGQYTPSHPDVVAIRRQIAELKVQMKPAVEAVAAAGTPEATAIRKQLPEPIPIQQLRAQLAATEGAISEKHREQASIQGRMGTYMARVQASPQVEEEYKALTRDSGIALKNYDDLLVKKDRSKLTTDLERRQEGEQFRVMDEPNLPDAPSFPKVWQFALAGLLAGIFVGGGIAAFLEYKDTALRTERDIWAFTRLPTLAVISVAGAFPEDVAAPAAPGGPKRFFGSIFGRFRRKGRLKTDSSTLADARG